MSGFYKNDEGALLFAPTQVSGPGFDLYILNKDIYTYPIEGWYYFDSEDEARAHLNIPKPIPEGTLVDLSSIAIWRARTVLKNHGLFDTIEAYVEAHKVDNITLYEVWNYGNFIDRNSNFINSLAPMFGLTSEQIDALFLEAAALTA